MNPLTFTTCQAHCTEEIGSAVSSYLSERLGIAVRPVTDIGWQERISRVVDGRIDVGWICGSYYSRQIGDEAGQMELLAAPVMAQPRYGGQPVYYSDVVVRVDSPFQDFESLRGASFAYNEPGSFSGYWSMRSYLAGLGEVEGFFGRIVGSGGHLKSLKMIQAGEVDTAAIDSTVWDYEIERNPAFGEEFRVVTVIGPTPIPPWVVRRALPEEQKADLRLALLGMGETEAGRKVLDGVRVRGFTAVSDDYYDVVRGMLEKAAVVDWGGVVDG